MTDKKEDRIYHWAMISVFSAIVLGSAVDTFTEPTRRQKWGVSCAAITMSLGAIVPVVFKVKPELVGRNIESVLGIVVLLLWIVNLPFYSGSGDIFVDDFRQSSLVANIYYFSWAALFTSVHLVARLFTEGLEMVEQVKTRYIQWCMLFALNLVVLCTASYNYSNKGDIMDDKWRRITILALIIGAVTAFTSGATMCLMSSAFLENKQAKIECLWSLVNTALYAVTIAWINGSEGPGRKIGNMYYFMWLSFVVSTYLSLECCNDLWTEMKEPESAEKEKDAGTVGDEEHHQEEPQEQEAQAKDENVAANV